MLDDIKNKIDMQQFGSLRRTSTTFWLIDEVYNWLKTLDTLTFLGSAINEILIFQPDLDALQVWAAQSDMTLNREKCEMIVSFLHS